MGAQYRQSQSIFLSHLSGDEDIKVLSDFMQDFLSHLSGDEATLAAYSFCPVFLSHLSGDEVNYLKR